MRSWRWLTLGWVVIVVGCCSMECETERLPNKGVVETSQQLYELAQHSAQHECWEVLYDRMSEKTRGEHSYLEIWAALKIYEVDEPWSYEMRNVVARGDFVAVYPDPRNPKREVLVLSYTEPPRPELLAQILVVEEQDESGRTVKRMAFKEQLDGGPPFNQQPPPEKVPGGK